MAAETICGGSAGEQGVATDGRHFAGDQHGRHRRRFEIRRIGVPDAAEVVFLVRQLQHRNDQRKIVNAFDEGVFDAFAKALGEGLKLRWRQWLIAKGHDAVLQPDAANLGQCGITHDTLQINAADCSADRTGQGLNVQRLGRICHAAIFAEIPQR